MGTQEETVVLAPAKVVAALCGSLLVVYGLTGVAFGGAEFGTAFPDGRVSGNAWLGIEGNGWTNLLFVAAGCMLISAAPGLWGARVMEVLIGVALLVLAFAARGDGHGVFGVVAANEWTVACWTVVALILLIASYVPAGER